jgi:wyosine [tRNA(Phe)-imidazoG37] synthetase (radical SAM superfamily)
MHSTNRFGQLSSRRLGRSLGIDPLLFTTCNYDCVYCECGATTVKTVQRNAFSPLDAVLDELFRYLCSSPGRVFITFSGFGEPTLSLSFGEVLKFYL